MTSGSNSSRCSKPTRESERRQSPLAESTTSSFRCFSRPSGVAAAATGELGIVYKVDIQALVASFYTYISFIMTTRVTSGANDTIILRPSVH